MSATSTTLARKWAFQVTADLNLATGWTTVAGLNDFDPEVTPNLEDSSDYDTNGWTSSEPTMQSWTASATFFRRITGGIYDPGQEILRETVGQFGAAARVGARWYDKNSGPEANSGIAIPTWKRSNTAYKNLEQVQATLTGTDIALNQNITNPASGAAIPVILSATPSGAAAGALVTITGSGFLGTIPTTGVKFAAVNATAWVVESDNLIVAIMPTGSAGPAAITVTNAAGASATFPYIRA